MLVDGASHVLSPKADKLSIVVFPPEQDEEKLGKGG